MLKKLCALYFLEAFPFIIISFLVLILSWVSFSTLYIKIRMSQKMVKLHKPNK